jgi:hypothetical protein
MADGAGYLIQKLFRVGVNSRKGAEAQRKAQRFLGSFSLRFLRVIAPLRPFQPACAHTRELKRRAVSRDQSRAR